MSIPSYSHFRNSPGFNRYEPTKSYFDYYSPGTEFGGVKVSKKGSYIIRDETVLTCQLAEMFNRDLPEFVYNGEYISKGIININKQHMYEYLHGYNKNLPIPLPKDANRYIGDIGVVNYVSWKICNALTVSTNGGGQILAYRFRYIFPEDCGVYPIKSVTSVLYKNLQDHIICYSYSPSPNSFCSDAIDIIISNATYRKLNGKRGKTLSSFMNYTTSRINSDLDYKIRPNSYNDNFNILY